MPIPIYRQIMEANRARSVFEGVRLTDNIRRRARRYMSDARAARAA